jgi:hypothetical protein
LILGRLSHRPVQEPDLDASPGQFFKHERLVGVPARQAVWTMDVEEVDGPDGGLVAHLLQGRPDERGTAPALIKKTLEVREVTAVGRNPCLEIGDLAGDRVGLRLLLGGDPCVECHLDSVHDRVPSLRCTAAGAGSTVGLTIFLAGAPTSVR